MRRTAMRVAAAVVCLSALSTCFLDGSGNYDGDYAFQPDTTLVDTNIYPLRHFVVVEDGFAHMGDGDGRDREERATIVFYFEGDIGAADLGFSDLRRLARHFNRFDMAFDTPRGRFVEQIDKTTEEDETDDQDEQAPNDAFPESRELRHDGRRLTTLHRLDGDQLAATGASRFLRTLNQRDFKLAAYAGWFSGSLPTDGATIEGTHVRIVPKAGPGEPSLTPNEDAPTASLQRNELTADYVVVELMQTIVRMSDPEESDVDGDEDAGMEIMDGGEPGRRRLDDGGLGDAGVGDAMDEDGQEDRTQEALMRTEMLPATRYTVGVRQITGGLELGCWSLDAPLVLRLIQVGRQYERDEAGDFAIIHRRFETVLVPAQVWHPLVEDPEPARYCDDFLPSGP